MSKKYNFVLIGLIILIFMVIGLAVFSKQQEKDLPTFMDNKEKISVSAGDFKYEKQAHIGDENAPVKVIEFFDYKCPACKNWSVENLEKFKKDYVDTGKVALYFINFPFLGPDSITAAMMAEIMWKQSPEAFLEYHEAMFEHQKAESKKWAIPSYLDKLVKDYVPSADYEKAKKDMDAWVGLFETKEDFKITSANGVSGTPIFFVDGVKVDSNYEVLTKAIDSKLSK